MSDIPLDEQIRIQLSRLLAGEITLRAFEDWLVPATWDVHLTDNRAAEGLAYRISHRLREYAHGDWSVDELRQLLAPLTSPEWDPDQDADVGERIESPHTVGSSVLPNQ
jgi:hypothetical protein